VMKRFLYHSTALNSHSPTKQSVVHAGVFRLMSIPAEVISK
jgi:hypothetical protein